ncbi:imelysin family protein [Aestuariirhabdus sp. Z084]|uniref:imelysin family protein n=1 Tax=Aestuariirhabdus haliotis TaxID=2918751 RepID=UPI00201B3F1F|nr:imelysin family protein [Aestuariirhabdus haliotis]MCL6415129.1 imelysin family protein [Aestuariirhabdus haliotis]MCL6419061.1 imelysin family protein [Aestuariirhabdus haliotis]
MRATLTLCTLVLLTGCEPAGDSNPYAAESNTTANAVQAQDLKTPLSKHELGAFSQNYLQQARKQCASALFAAQQLQQASDELLKAPTIEALEKAQTQWQKAHRSWLRCDLFSGNQGPLEQPMAEDPFSLKDRLASWPISPGYVDAMPGYPSGGLVYSADIAIKRASLLSQHQLTAPNEASIGLYPMEVLLFGINDSRSPEELLVLPPQPDQLDSQTRRRDYLTVLSSLYVSDLRELVTRWDPLIASYPNEIKRQSADQQTQQLVSALQQRLEKISKDAREISLGESDYSSRHQERLSAPLNALEIFAASNQANHPQTATDSTPAADSQLSIRIKTLAESLSKLSTETDQEATTAALSELQTLVQELPQLLADASNPVTASAQ